MVLPPPFSQCAVQPPSTGRAVPVIEAPASVQRKTPSAPSSSTPTKRLLGCWASRMSADHLLARNAVALGLAVDLLLDKRGQDIARADGVAGDAGFGAFQRSHLGEADHAMLGGDIGRLEGRGDQAVRRGGVNDPAPAARLHAGDDEPGGVEGRAQVDRQDGVPFLGRELFQWGDELDAGVVDQDVDLAERGAGALGPGWRSQSAGSCRRRRSGFRFPIPRPGRRGSSRSRRPRRSHSA